MVSGHVGAISIGTVVRLGVGLLTLVTGSLSWRAYKASGGMGWAGDRVGHVGKMVLPREPV